MFDDLGGDLRGSHERAEVLSGRDMIGRGSFCLGRLIAITDSLAVIFREQQIHALQKVVTLEPYVKIPILEEAQAEQVDIDQGWQRTANACRNGKIDRALSRGTVCQNGLDTVGHRRRPNTKNGN